MPPGEHIVLVGDSTVRYMYLGLAYALKFGQERCDFLGAKSVEHKYSTWAEFFKHTTEELAPHEICDCSRSMKPGTFATQSVENRYFTLEHHNMSVAYLSWYGYERMHGYWWPGTPLPSTFVLPQNGSRAHRFTWEMNYAEAHTKLLTALQPTTVVLSGAAHHDPVDMRGHVNWSRVETWRHFSNSVRAAVPAARIVWSTPTDKALSGMQQSDRTIAEQFFAIFDAHAVSQRFDRPRDWYADGTHLRCQPNYALVWRLLEQLFGKRTGGSVRRLASTP